MNSSSRSTHHTSNQQLPDSKAPPFIMASVSRSAPPPLSSLPSSTHSVFTSPYHQAQTVDVTAPAPQLVKMTPYQAESCRYPIGCPVWIPHHSSEFKFRQGVVNSVLVDISTKEIVYEVLVSSVGMMGAPSDLYGEVSRFNEESISFAPLAPVYVALDDPNRRECGVVLLPKKINERVSYIVQFDGLYEENIDAMKVSYRSGRFFMKPSSAGSAVTAPFDEANTGDGSSRWTNTQSRDDPEAPKEDPAVRNAVTPGKAVDASTLAAALSSDASSVVELEAGAPMQQTDLDVIDEAMARLGQMK